MRTISSAAVTDAVARLCVRANTQLPPDIVAALARSRREEPWPLAQETLGLLWDNLELAGEKELPICQDTGMACVFVELGQEVHIQGDFEQAIHTGVQRGYGEGYLRKSIVADPLRRVNTGDNTPAAITLRLVPGNRCTITVAPKGFGSENMSRLAMLKPADGVEGVRRFVVDTVKQAGSGPLLRRPGGGAAGRNQRPGHWAPGLRRPDHLPGAGRRNRPHPCGGAARGGECQLSRHPPGLG